MASRFLLLTCAALALHAEIRFNRDIRPIMADTCFRCHGPDKAARAMGLRLDIRDEALKKTATGVFPIVPGDPAKSAIIERVFAANARVMPPAAAHKALTGAQKEALRQWVAEGARYETHWAYEPIRRPVPPGGGNPIDAFLLARLQREGLTFSAEADARTLIRRVSLDLTGLPPTPAEIEAFAADRAPDGYARLVDRLLASPRHAEKQAIHWLDAVRYADTCGFHGDNPFPAWPYRDWVLKAFRDNMPFDRFTREQLAGDLGPDATVETRVASAYNRMNRTSAEGGLQPKEYVAKYGADRVRTTATVWLGSTLGCAECHDHKFDPFTARDFYSMKAFFADVKETGLVPDRGPAAWGTQLALPSPETKSKLAALDGKIGAARAKLGSATPEWEKDLLSKFDAGELRWHYQKPLSAVSSGGASLEIFNDRPVDSTYQDGASLVSDRKNGNGLVIVTGKAPEKDAYTVTFRPGSGSWAALAVEAVQDESLPGVRVARGADRLVLTEVEIEVNGKRVPATNAVSNLTFPADEHPAGAAIDGNPKTGFGLTIYGNNGNIALGVRFGARLETAAASVVTVRLRHDSDYRKATLGRFRLALSPGDSAPQPGDPSGAAKTGGLGDALVQALRAEAGKRTKEQKEAIAQHFQFTQAAGSEVTALEAERAMLDATVPRVVVTEATEPSETRILARGNFMDDSGPVVEPSIPAFLGRLETNGRRATRLDLATWLTSKENPLTARVWVNRTWRQFFGAGLSRTLDDAGSQGDPPMHAELLDWLAAEFMEPSWQAAGAHGWDTRHLARTIVLSRAYRQSSGAPPALEQRDPDNRLLARQSRWRVDAELVRDITLKVSGLLTEKFGGPSFRPYQPEGFLAALNFPKRDYSATRGPDQYRRGIYAFWQRTFLHPSMSAFDAPTREECTVNRTTSNTPLQALELLNDPIYVEAARVFAQNLWKGGGRSIEAKVDWGFLRVAGRKPDAEERAALAALYSKALDRYKQRPEEARKLTAVGDAPGLPNAKPAELAALTTVARAILNLHETITRN
jgi:hypothetical protein